MRTVLVIDDNPAVSQALSLLFGLHDIRTLTAVTPQKGLSLVAREKVDLVIADMNFTADTTSGEEGVALFRALRAQHPDLPVILLTAWTHLEAAVQLIKAGAADYIGKPWDNDKLLATVENLLELAEATLERQRLQEEQRRRREKLAEQYDLCDIVFASDAMERVVELACRVARADVRVLITGPNGAGKERIAQIVHANSAVRSGPFVAINCGAIPAELIESELFGAEAGAYTGAGKARVGRFELADGGTLFLDEIGELPIEVQSKLLRALQEKEIERVGGRTTIKTDVRIITATNRNLLKEIAAGRFRMDLYYRINVFPIYLPPLRERKEDIPALAIYFLKCFGSSIRSEAMSLSGAALRQLEDYSWPGNIRELQYLIERHVLQSQSSRIEEFEMPDQIPGNGLLPITDPEIKSYAEMDRQHIISALKKANGKVSGRGGAAELLKLRPTTLASKMKRLGITWPIATA